MDSEHNNGSQADGKMGRKGTTACAATALGVGVGLAIGVGVAMGARFKK
jgi:transketolase N-terminal domain/subunit